MNKVSIKHIAQALGVSSASVSLVLNGKEKEGRVSKELSRKIREKADELNYKPNRLARGLRMGKSYTIGLIIADISNPFFANLAFYIQEYAEKSGYTVIITNTNESDLKLEKMINILSGQQVDGLIIVPTANSDGEISRLIKTRLPLVLLDRPVPDLLVNHVIIDNYGAARDAVGYLIENGCKKPALICYHTDLSHMNGRKRGYIDTLREVGLYDESRIKEVNHQNIEEEISVAIDELLAEEKEVDSLFFATNTISMIGIKKLLALKLRIPEDIQVVCFDKNDAFDLTSIKVPYILQPIQNMGEKAVEILINQIEKNSEPEQVEFIANLIS